MGTTPDLEATASVRIKLRRALALALIIAGISFVDSQNISGRLFVTAPVAADIGDAAPPGQSRGSSAVGGNSISPHHDFESSIGGRYGGFDVAVISSRGIATNNSGRPIIVVEVAVRNSTDRQLRLPASMFGLSDESGRFVPIHRFEHTEHSGRLVLEPGLVHDATLVIRLPPLLAAVPSLYRLQIAEPYREPLVLPINADPALPPSAGVATGAELTIGSSPTDGATLLELKSTYNHRAYRARSGHHLVVLTADIPTGTDASSESVAKSRWWSVVLADEPAEAAVPAASVAVDGSSNGSTRVTVVFEVPISASELTVVTGEAEPTGLRFDLVVSEPRQT